MKNKISEINKADVILEQNNSIALAILFADIAESTKLFENNGDKKAQRVINNILSRLSKEVMNHNGKVIKTIGDEILCSFQDVNDAVESAIGLHKICDMDYETTINMQAINIQIGISYGPVIIKNNDVFGETVIMAKRMVDMAKQREIIVSRNIINTLKPSLLALTQHIEKIPIKGKTGEYDIYEIMWEVSKKTIMNHPGSNFSTPKNTESTLELEYQDKTFIVNKKHAEISIGREPHNDLVIDSSRISRLHAVIEFRKGKFFLKDHSSNGTYIVFEKAVNNFLKRNEAELFTCGMIFPGQNLKTNNYDAIKFSVKEN